MGLVYGHHVWVVFIKVGRPHVAHVDHDVGLGGGLFGCDDRWLLHQWVAPTPWPAVYQGAVVPCALAERLLVQEVHETTRVSGVGALFL